MGFNDSNGILLTSDTRYMVRFDLGQGMVGQNEYLGSELIGPGFQNVMNIVLAPGQRIYITYNGRESTAEVLSHDFTKDEVCVRIPGNGIEVSRHLRIVEYITSHSIISVLSTGCFEYSHIFHAIMCFTGYIAVHF